MSPDWTGRTTFFLYASFLSYFSLSLSPPVKLTWPSTVRFEDFQLPPSSASNVCRRRERNVRRWRDPLTQSRHVIATWMKVYIYLFIYQSIYIYTYNIHTCMRDWKNRSRSLLCNIRLANAAKERSLLDRSSYDQFNSNIGYHCIYVYLSSLKKKSLRK